jgi:hypothetical protein
VNFKALFAFPKWAASIVTQMAYNATTEVETFLLAVTSLLIGLQKGILNGLTFFFGVYYFTRMLGGYVSLIASKIHLVALSNKREEK